MQTEPLPGGPELRALRPLSPPPSCSLLPTARGGEAGGRQGLAPAASQDGRSASAAPRWQAGGRRKAGGEEEGLRGLRASCRRHLQRPRFSPCERPTVHEHSEPGPGWTPATYNLASISTLARTFMIDPKSLELTSSAYMAVSQSAGGPTNGGRWGEVLGPASTAPHQACCGCGERRARAHFAERGYGHCVEVSTSGGCSVGEATGGWPLGWPGGRNSHHFRAGSQKGASKDVTE